MRISSGVCRRRGTGQVLCEQHRNHQHAKQAWSQFCGYRPEHNVAHNIGVVRCTICRRCRYLDDKLVLSSDKVWQGSGHTGGIPRNCHDGKRGVCSAAAVFRSHDHDVVPPLQLCGHRSDSRHLV
jgi:hypothetical protein